MYITSCTPVCQPQPPNGGYDENIFIITPDSLKCPVCLLVVRDKAYLLSCCGALICQVCFRVVSCCNLLLTLTMNLEWRVVIIRVGADYASVITIMIMITQKSF